MLPSAKFEPSSQPPSERIVKVILAVHAFLADKGFYRPPPRLPFFIAHRFIAETVIMLAAKLGEVSLQRFPPSASILKQVSHHFGIVGKLNGSSQMGQAKPALSLRKVAGLRRGFAGRSMPEAKRKGNPVPKCQRARKRGSVFAVAGFGQSFEAKFLHWLVEVADAIR